MLHSHLRTNYILPNQALNMSSQLLGLISERLILDISNCAGDLSATLTTPRSWHSHRPVLPDSDSNSH